MSVYMKREKRYSVINSLISLQAYKEWLKNNTDDEKRLPDVPFTHEQLFFLKGAQVWQATKGVRLAYAE